MIMFGFLVYYLGFLSNTASWPTIYCWILAGTLVVRAHVEVRIMRSTEFFDWYSSLYVVGTLHEKKNLEILLGRELSRAVLDWFLTIVALFVVLGFLLCGNDCRLIFYQHQFEGEWQGNIRKGYKASIFIFNRIPLVHILIDSYQYYN